MALIENANHARCNLQNTTNEKEIVNLLKNRIEECIINDNSITIIVTNMFSECRFSLHVDVYELETDYLYLNGNNTEIHIKSNNVTELKYDNTDMEYFIIKGNDGEVIFIF